MNGDLPRPPEQPSGQEVHALAGAYAVDALEGDERREFEQHLASCRACREEVASLREAAAELSGLTGTTAPAQLRGRVLDAIAGMPQLGSESERATPTAPSAATGRAGHEPPDELARKRVSRSRKVIAGIAAAVAAAIIVVGGVTWHPWSRDQSSGQLTATQQVLQANDARRLVQQVDGATATIVVSASQRKAVLLTEDMPAAPKGHVYELWYFDSAGTPTRAGLVPHDRNATVLLKGDAASATGVGITVEPAGGSRQPTTQPVVTFDLT